MADPYLEARWQEAWQLTPNPPETPWEWLGALHSFDWEAALPRIAVQRRLRRLASPGPLVLVEGDVWVGQNFNPPGLTHLRGPLLIGDDVTIDSQVSILGPGIIRERSHVGLHSILRGPFCIGPDSLLGEYSMVMRSVVGERTWLAHYNSLMSSVMGARNRWNGFNAVLNLRVDARPAKPWWRGRRHHQTDFFKYGATIGDDVWFGSDIRIWPGADVPDHTCCTGSVVFYGAGKERSQPFPKSWLRLVRQAGQIAQPTSWPGRSPADPLH